MLRSHGHLLLRTLVGTTRYNSTSSNELLRDLLNKSKEIGSQTQTKTHQIPKDAQTPTQRQSKPRHNNNNNNKNGKKTRLVVINWTTGTQRAQDAANFVIKEIFKLNHSGTIKAIETRSNRMHVTNIREFAKGIDLDTAGLSIVDVENVGSGETIPLVKLVESRVALRRYSDELARQKEEELRAKGLLPRGRSGGGGNGGNGGSGNNGSSSGNNGSDGGLKHIKVSWQIELDDLVRQKIKEVLALLKKGHKVNIYIGDRNKISSSNWLDTFEDLEQGKPSASTSATQVQAHLPKREIKKREDIVREIRMVLEEYTSKLTIEGNIRSKMMVKLVPKPQNTATTTTTTTTTITTTESGTAANDGTLSKQATIQDKRALKEERRRQRQEKLQQRTERKQQQRLLEQQELGSDT